MIAIGCDHGGYELKSAVIKHLVERGEQYKDFGSYDNASIDYPVIADKVAKSVTSGECECGILICGTGIGMSIAANKHKGIRAALVSDCFSAEYTKRHNDANVICIGGRVIGQELAFKLVDAYLDAEFEGGRHSARLALINEIENNNL